ncbi:hypothetical protein VTN77DRAFT_5022 [Rasamsonia byssochlamydoides]|uniref:uncharacterized protein n=1 Tax=Rasamsonia byssochlamydoides TaxID=89139 RepID=UPI003741F595
MSAPSPVVAVSRQPVQPSTSSQIKFIRPAQMSLFARVTCYPPLGEVTCVRRFQQARNSSEDDKLRFTVILSSSVSFPEQDWEVDIWHNIGNSNWSALSLKKCHPTLNPTMIGSEAEQRFYHYTFSEEIALPSSAGHASFTVRYRTGPDAQWQWATQRRFVKDGELIFGPRNRKLRSSESSPRNQLGEYIQGLPSELDIQSRNSEAPEALLWSIAGDVPAAQEQQSGTKKLPLGSPTSYLRYFSLVRVWSPWLAPRHGKKEFRLTEDAVLCSFLRSDGLSLVLLAVSGVNEVLTVFQSGEKGEVVVQAKNDNPNSSKFQILASVAENFEVAICALIYEARKIVRDAGGGVAVPIISDSPPPDSPASDDVVVVEKDARAQWLADWYDGLTYCTWNGLGQNLTEKKILDALDTLKDHGISIVNLILDDNWQLLDNEGESQFRRGWKAFEANPDGFPAGLRRTAELIRQRHPNVEHIAVWHALMGYWGGISPNGELAKKYKTKEVVMKDPVAGGKMLAIDPDDIRRFYEDFYSFLTSAGVDAVKTDAQFYLDLLEDPEDRRRFTTAYQDAWSIASLRYFSTRSISCMSMAPQIIFHSQMPTNKPSILLRNSDDYFPDVPDSHPWHVFCNAHNALLTRHLNVIPDWDMFQTSHPYASFHAAARCVSGGPIYITDEPGKHDIDLINQITAPTTRGNTVILRPSVLGRTSDVYHDYNEGNMLRIGTYTGWARTGSGILGLFNISAADVSSIIPLTAFPGVSTESDDRYIIRSHSTGAVTDLMRPLGQNSVVAVSLEPRGWEILTAYPIRSFTLEGSRGCSSGSTLTHVAVLGLLGKMTGVAAVVSSDIYVVDNGRLRFDINLKALGVLGIYFSDLGKKSIDQHVIILISGQPIPRQTVWKDGGEHSKVLAVDVLRAWKALRLDSGWSNEVAVQIFVS